MKILIIGSKGFIGSHCVSYFSNIYTVWQCDVSVDYISDNYIQVDATNVDYTDVFQKQEFDVCINCSGAASVPDSLKNPQRDFLLNTVNVFRQLDAIRKYNPKCRYINLSSAAVYGNPKYLPIDELHPLTPISPYGIHKKYSEEICKEFYETYKISTCSLRLFSAYGRGLKKQLFWDLHKKAINNSNIDLFGTGRESRDFIHISDLVHAIHLVIKKCQFKNDIINIANGEELFIDEVVDLFYDIYDSKLHVNFQGQNRKGDPVNWVADLTKLNALGYTSKTDLKKGLKDYITWLREEE